jgi:hypothetical protein
MAVDNGRTLSFYQANKKQGSYSLNIRPVQFNTTKLEWVEI